MPISFVQVKERIAKRHRCTKSTDWGKVHIGLNASQTESPAAEFTQLTGAENIGLTGNILQGMWEFKYII